ncbi:MAG: gfo/Idh/MocA family oxidoreductase [Candidatus Aenigmatarchaeota archaeon]|nr:MAG: gfo/Idh/MocA family oxidoreductase [Candidatus Aenigmarchaeota archaeon]
MKRYKAAVIGLGHQGIEDWIPGIVDSQFATLKAICDSDRKKLDVWKEKLKVNAYENYKELLSREALDFVVIATPHDTHKPITEEAFKHGIHVLKEKPFARSLKEALYLRDLAEKYETTLMIVAQRRFNPIYTTFFQLKDQIGEPFFIEAKYSLFIEKPYIGWRGDRKRAGGGCIIDMGYHIIDILIWYFGLPDRVHAEFSTKACPEINYKAEDTATILFSYGVGLYGNLVLSRYYPPKSEYIKLIGSRGIIEVERGKIKRKKSDGEVVESLSRDVAWPTAAINQIDYFCRVINSERENFSNPDYHLQHMSFIEACYLSKRNGCYVSPKEILEKKVERCQS